MSRVSLKKLLDRSDRNMAKGTHPVVRKSALKVIELAYKEGINAQISEGNRSNARQNELYAQGRTTGGNIVTNARAGQSWHNYGVAIDYFLTNNSGSTAIWTVNAKWRRVADIAQGLGFEWGGVWKSFVDYPHLQMTGGLSLSDLRAGKKPKLSMKDGSSVSVSKPSKSPSKPSQSTYTSVTGSWTGQTLRNGVKGKPVTQLQTKLSDNYFYPNKSAKNNGIDSYYGGDTEDAVRRYQSMKGLKYDGIAGKEVYASLGGKKSSSKPKSSSYPLPNGSFGRGSKGNQVKKLQRALNKINFKVGNVDGIYGEKTENAVYRVQLMKETTSDYRDGIYGKRTKGYIESMLK